MESIGVKIQVDGGKEFKTQLDNIKATSKELSAELKNVVNGLDSTGNKQQDTAKKVQLLVSAYDNAGKKLETLTSQLDKQENNLREMQSALEAAKTEYGETSPEVAKLNTQITKQSTEIAKTKTQIADTTGEMGKYKNELADVGYKTDGTEMSTRELKKAVKDAGEEADKSSKKGWTVLKGTLKDLVSDAIKSVTSALSGLVDDAIEASDAMSKFGQTMSFAGFDPQVIEETQAAVQKYADSTVYDLNTIANTTAQLGANGVKDFEALVEATGNLNAVAGGNAQTFESVAMALTQTAGAGKLTTENWRQMTNQIPGAAGVLQEALKTAGAYTGDFQEALKNGEITAEEFNAAIMQVGTEPIAVEAAASVQTFEGAVGNLKATAVSALQAIIDEIGMENITAFLTNVSDFIATKVIPAIRSVANWVRTDVMPVIQNMMAWFNANVLPKIQEVVSWLQNTGFPAVSKVVSGIVSAVQGIINAAKKVVDFFKNMKIKLPHIDLPHFYISGKFSLNPLSVPRLGVDWYDKGGVFNRPSIIGVGERRPEFVGALDDLRTIVREESGPANVNINVYASDNMDVEELASVVSDKIQNAVYRREAVYA